MASFPPHLHHHDAHHHPHIGGVAHHDDHQHHHTHTSSKKFDVTISFAAGGWFQMYHFGVCKAMLDSGFLDDLEAAGKRVRFCGSSAGALAAASLASGCRMHEEMRDFAVMCAEHYRESHWHFMCMREYLNASIHRFGDRMMETPEQRQRTLDGMSHGRLEIYTTTLPFFRRKCMTEFTDLDDIEEALVASCCLTPVVGFPFPLRKTGEWVCDGGMRSFQPRKGEPRTITVSPFYFTSADIHPSRPIPVWWGMYPPPKEDHLSLFTLGYNDALDYLMLSNRIGTDRGAKLLRTMAPQKSGSRFSRASGGKFAAKRSEQGGIGQLAGDLFMTLAYLVVLRPLAIVCIYLEMVLVVAVLLLIHPFLKGYEWMTRAVAEETQHSSDSDTAGVENLHDPAPDQPPFGGIDWRPLYETFRNFVSFRVLLRLLVSSKIPINEARLIKRSRLYRAFQPLVFERGGRVRSVDSEEHLCTKTCDGSETDADNPKSPHGLSGGGVTPQRRRRKFFVETFWNSVPKPWKPPHVATWDTAIADTSHSDSASRR